MEEVTSMNNNDRESSRRQMLRLASVSPLAGGLAGAVAAAPASMAGVKFEPRPVVRLAFIGVGGRGSGLIGMFSLIPEVQFPALCDIFPEKTRAMQAAIERAGKAKPERYHGSEHAFEQLLTRDDIDLVVVATPWIWHVPIAVAAMKSGKHVAVEVPAARTVEECWQLVDTSEKTRRHCILLENACYGQNMLLLLNLLRDGALGEVTHGACAYNHDLRALLFSNQGEGLWRRKENAARNGNLYPTHGLGPVANYMGINRGDRFDYLVSMSSPSLGLQAYRTEKVPPDDPRQKEIYRNGDMNISLIKTVKGRLITLEHDVATPQPFDTINLIAGTKGIYRDYPPRIFVDGAPKHAFGPLDPYRQKYEHAYWRRYGDAARKTGGGHDGIDFVMACRVVDWIRNGTAPDIDVYDAAAWSAAGPLSEASVAAGSTPRKFPDFMRGAWQNARPVMPEL
jgi:hypothetical protein